MVVAAVPWWFWIGVSLVFPTILMIVATVIGYLMKVVAPKYPRRVE